MQSPVFLVNSRLCLVSATTSSSGCTPSPLWHPFSLSYGVNLQSSLTIVLPLTLAFSASPPVSVSGTGARGLLRSFSWQSSVNAFVVISDNSHSGLTYKQGDLPPRPGFALRPAIPSAGAPSFLRHSIVVTNSSRDRISNLLSISYAFRPDLRSRLTLGGSTFPRNPWTSGECDSHTLRVTHAGILSCMQSTHPSGRTSPRIQRSPTDSTP